MIPHFIPEYTAAGRRNSIGKPQSRITAEAVTADLKMQAYAENAEIAANKSADATKNDNMSLLFLPSALFSGTGNALWTAVSAAKEKT